MAYPVAARWTKRQLRRDIPVLPDAIYMGSDDTGHYFVPKPDGLGDIGDMFKRMFKFTSKSFTPANISRSIWRLTPVSVGLQLVAPKIEKTIYKDVVPIALPVAAGVAAAAAFGPSIWQAIGPKLTTAAGIIGKNASSIGGFIGKIMGGLSPAGQAAVAEQITPQQIAQIEQTGQVPADVQRMLQTVASQYLTQPTAAQSSTTGAAELYPNGGALPEPVRAGATDTGTLIMFGGLALAAVLLGKK